MKVTIEKITDVKFWDESVEKNRSSSFLSSGILEAMKSEYSEPVFYSFKQNDEIVAFLSGLLRPVGKGPEKQLFCFSGISLIKQEATLLHQCKSELLSYALKSNIFRIFLKTYDESRYVEAKVPGFYVNNPRAECIISLEKDEMELSKGFTKNVRKHVKRARERGLEFKEGKSADLLDKLIDLVYDTLDVRVSKGYSEYVIFVVPFLDREVMLKLLNSGNATLYYAQIEGEIVSMQFTYKSLNRAYGVFMGTNSRGYELSAPSLLFHDIAFDLHKNGFYSYSLGGVPPGDTHDGVKKFKLTMGADLFDSDEEMTDYLMPPLNKYNKYLKLKRGLLKSKIPGRFKKPLVRFLNKLMGKRDRP